MSSVSQFELIHLGLDVHRDSIVAGVLLPGEESPRVERVFHDEVSVRRFVAHFEDPRRLRACYKAGPPGYELARLLACLGMRCDVVAPSLIPRAGGRQGQKGTAATRSVWRGCIAPGNWSRSGS